MGEGHHIERHDDELARVRYRLRSLEEGLDFLHGEIAEVKGRLSPVSRPLAAGKVDRTGETYDDYCARRRASRHKPIDLAAWLTLQERRPVR